MEVFAIGDAVSPARLDAYSRAIRHVREQSGARLSVHLPTTDCNPLARNRRVARAAVDSQRAGLEWAAEIGARTAVLHLGSVSGLQPSPAGTTAQDHFGAAWERARAVLAELAACARSQGITLTVENLIGASEVATLAEHLLALVDGPDLGEVGITVDLSHAVLSGEDPGALIAAVAPRLRHVHANDTDGVADRHWPLGQGVVPLAAAVDALTRADFAGTLVLEIDSPADVLLANRELVARLAGEAKAGA